MELLTVLALGAVILGSIVVGYGTLVRMRTGVAALVTLQLGAARTAAFALPGATGTSRNVVTAPSYGVKPSSPTPSGPPLSSVSHVPV
jgi:hypothetical protein